MNFSIATTTIIITSMRNLITWLQDARLTDGVALHKEHGWARVAQFMGDGLSAQHCKNRWNIYLKHWQKGLKSANWQPNEVPHPTAVLTYT